MNPKSLHPELESLIREAADERSGRILVSLAQTDAKLGLRGAGSKAKTSRQKLEAKLTTRYKDALADLYWHVGERLIYTAPATAKYLSLAQRGHRQPDLSNESSWKAHAKKLLSVPVRDSLPEHTERISRILNGEHVGLAETARAGYSLSPLADYRLHEACAHESNGDLDAAKKCLTDTLKTPHCEDDRGRALNNLGHIAGIEEGPDQEFLYYEQASRLLPREGPTIFYAARLAIMVGTSTQVRDSLDRIELLALEAPASYHKCLQALRAEALASTPLAPSIPRCAREHAGPQAMLFLELLG